MHYLGVQVYMVSEVILSQAYKYYAPLEQMSSLSLFTQVIFTRLNTWDH